MNFLIQPVTNPTTEAAAAYVREEVFGREWRLEVPRLTDCEPGRRMTLVACRETDGEPAAALTVLDTTGDEALHHRLGLRFQKDERIARYTQLAVLKPYRQQGIPVSLVQEAHRLFVGPGRFGHSWLLFDAGRAKSAAFCTVLGFRPGRETFETEYGRTRVLLRDEAAGRSHSIPRLRPDEWVAQ